MNRMRIHLAALILFEGVVILTAVQCGESTDMLTTGLIASDAGDESQVETAIEDGESEFEIPGDDAVSDSPACIHGEIPSSDVLLIGDSWISLPGPRIGELARAAGIMAFDEDYVYRAVGGATIDDIVRQYDNYTASNDSEVKVVIMNGGAVDTYRTGGSEESVLHVASTFSQYLSQLAEEGKVEFLIYSLYSEGSTIPGVVELRPLMKAACAESDIPCFFLDLQPIWEGHPEYTSADTINPSSDGSDAIAAAIWQIMQDNCIAQ